MDVRVAERRRKFEIAAMVGTTILLIALSRLESRLFELSQTLAKKADFITTVVNFGFINFYVVLVLLLGFLLFRNVAKLVVERRRGVFGSNLRAKLVAALMLFALAPTILFFYVSARYIINAFDEWFSEKVRATMHQTREAGARVYKQDQRRLESLARIALSRIRVYGDDEEAFGLGFDARHMEGFDAQYGLDSVKVFGTDARVAWVSTGSKDADVGQQSRDPFLLEALGRFAQEPGLFHMSTVAGEEQQDVVKGIAPITHPETHRLLGVVMTETRFETPILRSIESIQQGFADLRPSAQLIKLSYLILLGLMTLLVSFSAVWLGFYVARGITGPIQALAEGTREVALGNYAIQLAPRTDDETGQLVRSFNHMTEDLQRHRTRAEEARAQLLKSNEELDQRRKYMEVILENISAGVIAVGADGKVTSINDAAKSILGLKGAQGSGLALSEVLGNELFESFFRPISEGLIGHDSYRAPLLVVVGGKEFNLLVDATRIADEEGADLGFVLVFDDATEQVKAQRVAAWREVARRIAHEIKNPVTPIKLSAQRLLRRFNGRFTGTEQEVFESCLETILKQVDSLRDLVNEFSKFSRLPQVKPKLADLNAIVEGVIDLYRLSYPSIVFDMSQMARLAPFPLDKDQMNRVFVNLVTNAIQAMDLQTGVIEFRSTMLPDLNTVRIEVADNGQGIPAHLWDRVLEPYFSTKDGGTGLGLAIVHQIVTDHGGYLRLAANQPKGTRVIIELPTGRAAGLG